MVFSALLKRYFICCEASTALEYGLLVAGIAMAIIIVTFALGDEILTMFNSIGNALNEAFS